MTVLLPVILTVADWGVSGKIALRFELSSVMLLMETVAVPTFAAVKKSSARTPLPETPGVNPVRLFAMARMVAVVLLIVPVIPEVPEPRKAPCVKEVAVNKPAGP